MHRYTPPLQPINQFGTLANRPAANTLPAGTVYYATDIASAFAIVNGAWVNVTEPLYGAGPLNQPDQGESTFDTWDSTVSTSAASTGVLKLTYFRARKTETITSLRVYVGAVAAAATPTLCRLGVWSAETDSALTALLASTADNPALLTGSTFSRRTQALTTPWSKVRDTLYAVGVLTVSAGATAQFAGCTLAVTQEGEDGGAVRARILSGQTDLPASAAAGSLASTNNAIQFVMVP